MNQGNQRIPCPKCISNNFLGQPNCWNCGASLPPPEAMALPSPAAFQPPCPEFPAAQTLLPNTQPQYRLHPYANAPINANKVLGLRIAVWAIILLPILLAMGWYARTRAGGNTIEAQKDAAIKLQEDLTRDLDSRIKASRERPSGKGTLDTNSTESQARRELNRIYDKTGVGTPPPTDNEGNVHLQGGGTLSREKWEKARDSLRR